MRPRTGGPNWPPANQTTRVECLARADGTRLPVRPTSLAHLWCERRHLNRGYVLRKKGKPDPTPARAEERTASRFYQLKYGHALTCQEHGQQTG